MKIANCKDICYDKIHEFDFRMKLSNHVCHIQLQT